MIKAIVFDMGGVLINDDWPAYADFLSEKYGIDADEYLKFHIDLTHSKHDVGKCTTEEFIQEIRDHFNINITVEEFDKETLEIFHPIHKELWELIRSLKEFYTLGVLSNNNPLFVSRYRKMLDLDSHFNFQIFSCEAKMRKPEESIYKLMLITAGLRPEEIVFVDDKRKNLEPAEKLGITTVLFKDPVQLMEDLKSAGVGIW